jgi:hypothetical protein
MLREGSSEGLEIQGVQKGETAVAVVWSEIEAVIKTVKLVDEHNRWNVRTSD